MSDVGTQNRVGEWVPAIPEPFFGYLRVRCWECKRWFWTREGYRAHYALAHVLKLDEPRGFTEVSWPCGDRAYGRGRGFRFRAIRSRLWWHWKHRHEGGVEWPPGEWWSVGTATRRTR